MSGFVCNNKALFVGAALYGVPDKTSGVEQCGVTAA